MFVIWKLQLLLRKETMKLKGFRRTDWGSDNCPLKKNLLLQRWQDTKLGQESGTWILFRGCSVCDCFWFLVDLEPGASFCSSWLLQEHECNFLLYFSVGKIKWEKKNTRQMIEAKISLWFPTSSFKEIQVKQKKNTQISLESKHSVLEKDTVLIQSIRRNFLKNVLMTKTST